MLIKFMVIRGDLEGTEIIATSRRAAAAVLRDLRREVAHMPEEMDLEVKDDE